MLFDFLGSQSSILHLGYSGRGYLWIPETHLPNLISLRASPEALIEFTVDQRPITTLHLRRFVSDPTPLLHISRSSIISRLNCPIQHLSVAVDTLTEGFGSSLGLITSIFADHLLILELTFTGVPYGAEAKFWAALERFSKVTHLTLIMIGHRRHDNFHTERVLPHLPGQTNSFNEYDERPSALKSVVIVNAGDWDEYSRGAEGRWRHTGHDGPAVPYPQYELTVYPVNLE